MIQNTRGYLNTVSLGRYDEYLYPVYSLEGASYNYYEVDYNSISYDITNGKTYTIFFSGDSLSSIVGHTGNTLITHDLYRFPYSTLTAYLSLPVIQNNSPQAEETDTGSGLDDSAFEDIELYFTSPLLSITEELSAITITNNSYTYAFPVQYKDVGNFTYDVFSDKDQYMLDTSFSFELHNDLTIGDAYYLPDAENLTPTRLYLEPSATTFYTSSKYDFNEITGDTLFSGTTFRGAFFTYFVPPKKPNLNVSLGNQSISVQGLQTNLSPTFNFANVDDGDYYKLQVNYDPLDTPFSGSEIFTYIVNKQAGDAEYVRTYSTPLRASDDFIYRIGNTKELVNIFGNKQSITTWSDTISASIDAAGLFRFSGYTWRNFISGTYNGYYVISGMTIGANSNGPVTYNFSTTQNVSMPSNTISASTNGVNTITVEYNGTVSTTDWRNALYNTSSWSSLGLYIVNDNVNTAVTDSTFSFITETQGMPNANLRLYQIYNSTQLNVGIDLRSSRRAVVQNTTSYPSSGGTGIQFNRTSSSTGFFDFGLLNGGYYRLVVTPESPQYAAYISIDTYVTINSNTSLDLILYILWGNQDYTFDDLSNETFL